MAPRRRTDSGTGRRETLVRRASTAAESGAATAPRRSPENKTVEEMTREELLDFVRDHREDGIRITFAGKQAAKRIARKVQPRTLRRVPTLSVGSAEDQSRNRIIEGENLQGMVTLYKERGQADLILTDPPYNTGNDFRYNDKWDQDPMLSDGLDGDVEATLRLSVW